MSKRRQPVSPGEILTGKRTITADTDLRLCRFFGLSDGWWLRLQKDYDTEVAKATSRRCSRRSGRCSAGQS